MLCWNRMVWGLVELLLRFGPCGAQTSEVVGNRGPLTQYVRKSLLGNFPGPRCVDG